MSLKSLLIPTVFPGNYITIIFLISANLLLLLFSIVKRICILLLEIDVHFRNSSLITPKTRSTTLSPHCQLNNPPDKKTSSLPLSTRQTRTKTYQSTARACSLACIAAIHKIKSLASRDTYARARARAKKTDVRVYSKRERDKRKLKCSRRHSLPAFCVCSASQREILKWQRLRSREECMENAAVHARCSSLILHCPRQVYACVCVYIYVRDTCYNRARRSRCSLASCEDWYFRG